jgi:hypothetical protein
MGNGVVGLIVWKSFPILLTKFNYFNVIINTGQWTKMRQWIIPKRSRPQQAAKA